MVLFSLMVSEVPVPALLVTLVLDLGWGRNIMANQVVEESCSLHCSKERGRERERERASASQRGREWRPDIVLKGHTVMIHSLQSGPTSCFHFLPVKTPDYDLINGLTHWWSYSQHHHPVTSQKPVNSQYMRVWGDILDVNHTIWWTG